MWRDLVTGACNLGLVILSHGNLVEILSWTQSPLVGVEALTDGGSRGREVGELWGNLACDRVAGGRWLAVGGEMRLRVSFCSSAEVKLELLTRTFLGS